MIKASTIEFQNNYLFLITAAVGDAIGYKNGEWEFCKSGK